MKIPVSGEVRLPFQLKEPIIPVMYRLSAALLCVGFGYINSLYSSGNPGFAEGFLRGYLAISRVVSQLIGYLPFSLAELLLFLLPIGIIVLMVRRLKKRFFFRAVAGILLTASLFYAAFSGGWGIAYSREPYAKHAGLEIIPRSTASLQALCIDLVNSANELRAEFPEDASGVFVPSRSNKELLMGIQSAYDNASENAPWLAGTYGNPKPVFLSVPMSHLQISGIYIPFTFEANVNVNNNSFMIPSTAAHEAAHLRGWAREDEANFIAYYVCRESGDPEYQYSGTLLALIHAANALYSADSEAYWEITGSYCDGLRRDLTAHSEHWRQYEGKVGEIQEQINDVYLRSNRQEDGVRSYGRMVDLMLAEREK